MAGALERLPDRQRVERKAQHTMAAEQASGGGGGVISAKEYVDVKVDGVRSELKASIADLLAEVKGLSAKVEVLPTTWMVIGTIAGGFSVSLSLIFAFLSYSNQNAEHVRVQQKQLDDVVAVSVQTDRKLADITARLDRTAALSEENSQNISALSERIDGLADRVDGLAGRTEQLIEVVERDARRKK